MTGLFAHKTPHNQNVRNRSRAVAGAKLAAFAERLAEHGDTRRAARSLGFSPAYGRVLLKRLRADLGWQAQ